MKVKEEIIFRFLNLRFKRFKLVKSSCSTIGNFGFVIPAWAMYAIESSNYTNLSEKEHEKLNEFLNDLVAAYGNSNLVFTGESYFDTDNEIDHLAGDVYLAELKPSKENIFIVDLINNKLIMKYEFNGTYVFFTGIIYEIYSIFNLTNSDYNNIKAIIDKWVEVKFNFPKEKITYYKFSELNYRNDLIPCIMRNATEVINLDNIENQENIISEDLDVWFGKKKKPKGSSQPQGPWVNICKKDKNGKHPPMW